MQETECITIISNRRKKKLQKDQVLYVRSRRKYLDIEMVFSEELHAVD